MRADALRDDAISLADGRRLSWCELGAPQGRAVVYCHGLPGSRLEHPPEPELAAGKGLRFIVPDRPGYGGASPLPGRSLVDPADDIRALADHLDLDTFDVVGFSGGGPHALAVAWRLPERVRQLGLISSLAPFDHAGTEGMAEANQQLWGLARTDFPAFAEALESGLEALGGAYELLVGGAPPEDRALFEDPDLAAIYRQSLEEGMRQGATGMLEDAAAVSGDWPFAPDAIRCPVRLWHGDRDANAPVAMGRWLAAHLPDAELTEWPGTAHFGIFPHWSEILDALSGG